MTRSTSKLGPVAPVLGHAYYYDEGISRLVDGPLRWFASFLDRVVDTKIIDGAVNGVGWLFKQRRGIAASPAGRPRAAVRARHRVRHRRDPAVPRAVGGAVAVDFPILSAIIVAADHRRARLPPHAVRASRGREGGRLRRVDDDARPRRLAALELLAPRPGLPVRRNERWIPTLGVRYIVGVDGISIFMIAITALLFPIGLLASEKYITHRVKAYIVWFLLLEGAIMGIFLSLDLILFFVFWELMLVPMYFLIQGWGSGKREYAAMKFFIYTAAGSAFLLASIARARVHPPGRHRRPHLRLPRARGMERPVGHHRGGALPRVHGRVRDQGAAVPVPHLAAARAHRGADRGLRRAGRRDPQDGRLRLPPLLVRAVPAGVRRPRADPAGARGDRHHLRRDRRRDADAT